MSLSHHITRREVPLVRKALKRAGYLVSSKACYTHVSTLSDFLEPYGGAARERVRRFVAAALEGPYQVDALVLEEAIYAGHS